MNYMHIFKLSIVLVVFVGCDNYEEIEVLPTTYKCINDMPYWPALVVNERHLCFNYFKRYDDEHPQWGTTLLSPTEDILMPRREHQNWDNSIHQYTLFVADQLIFTIKYGIGLRGKKNVEVFSLYKSNLIGQYLGDQAVVVSDQYLFTQSEKTIYSYSLENDSIIWQNSGYNLMNISPVNNTIFADQDSILSGINQQNGVLKWSIKFQGKIHRLSAFHQRCGEKLIINTSSGITLVNAKNGDIDWILPKHSTRAKLVENEEYYYVNLRNEVDGSNKLTMLDKNTGSIIWQSKEEILTNSHAILYTNKVLIASKYGSDLIIYDAINGELLDRKNISVSNYIRFNERFFVYSGDQGGLYQVDLKSLFDY